MEALAIAKDHTVKEKTKEVEVLALTKDHTGKGKMKEAQNQVTKKHTAKEKTKEVEVQVIVRGLLISHKAVRKSMDLGKIMQKTVQKDRLKNLIQKIQDLAKEKTQEVTFLHHTDQGAKTIQGKETLE